MGVGVASGTNAKGAPDCAAKEDVAGTSASPIAAAYASRNQKFAALKRVNNDSADQRRVQQRNDMLASLTVTRGHACTDEAMG